MEANTPKGAEDVHKPSEHPKENKGLVQKLKEMLTLGNPDTNDPVKQAELAAAREVNSASQQQRAADRVEVMQSKIDSGAVPVVTAEEVQTGSTDVVPPPQTPENSQQ